MIYLVVEINKKLLVVCQEGGENHKSKSYTTLNYLSDFNKWNFRREESREAQMKHKCLEIHF